MRPVIWSRCTGHLRSADSIWESNWHRGFPGAETHKPAQLQLVAAVPSPSPRIIGFDLIDSKAISRRELTAGIAILNGVAVAQAVLFGTWRESECAFR